MLFASDDRSVILIDTPRSLEESQVPQGGVPDKHIYSAQPLAEPFETPEPKDGLAGMLQSPASQVADLMTAETVRHALEELKNRFHGPFCLPRLVCEGLIVAGHENPHIPSGAEYLHGSVEALSQSFSDRAPKFDLMILDPPWPNRSARRKTGSYRTARTLPELRQMLDVIPVPAHLAEGSLVAVWVTNKPRILEFLTGSGGVFASWGLELVTEWTWVKVTAAGEPIYDLDSQWRKPWEKLLIAKRLGTTVTPTLKPKVIFSVPDIHSRKPNLRGLFREFLGDDFAGLEVFARNLTAGWWSWGDEVLLFQGAQNWGASLTPD